MVPEYVSNLRNYIGHAPLLLVAAGTIIHKDRKILLQKRGDNGTWSIHGGCLELGETIEETVRRELKEEIGITPINLKFYKFFLVRTCIAYVQVEMKFIMLMLFFYVMNMRVS